MTEHTQHTINADTEQALFKQPPSQHFSIYDDSVAKSIPDTSTPLKKAVIEQEDKIRYDQLETGILFDDDGSILIIKQGKSAEVGFSQQEFSLFYGKTFTHNHPFGTSFSIADIERAIEYNLAELRVVTSLFRYSLKPKYGKNWCSKMALRHYFELIAKQADDVISDYIRMDIINPFHANYEKHHYIISQLSSILDLDYRREKS